jgi:phosphatidylglycerol:prolipoprotein diacylglycerol transferase
VLFEWMGVPWSSWHIFFALGGISAALAFYGLLRRAKPAISSGSILMVFAGSYLWMMAGAILWPTLFEGFPSPARQFSLFQSVAMSSSGGILAGATGFVVMTLALGLRLGVLVDAGVSAALIAFGIGRLGCFLNGDDYGWMGGFPVQLIESSICLAGFVVLVNLKCREAGQRGLYGVVLYACMRLATEPFRADWRGPPLRVDGLEFSPPQLVAAACLLCAFGAFAFMTRRRRTSP